MIHIPKQGEKIINFTPQQTGTLTFNCPMGMTTRGSAFEVVPNTEGIVPASDFETNTEPVRQIPNGKIQKVYIEVTRERGFYPRNITLKKNVPVEITVNAKVPLGGCMSVMVIPQYGVTLKMKLGESKGVFTPTETGIIYLTCSMGSKIVQFNVE